MQRFIQASVFALLGWAVACGGDGSSGTQAAFLASCEARCARFERCSGEAPMTQSTCYAECREDAELVPEQSEPECTAAADRATECFETTPCEVSNACDAERATTAQCIEEAKPDPPAAATASVENFCRNRCQWGIRCAVGIDLDGCIEDCPRFYFTNPDALIQAGSECWRALNDAGRCIQTAECQDTVCRVEEASFQNACSP